MPSARAALAWFFSFSYSYWPQGLFRRETFGVRGGAFLLRFLFL
jgi:hypothetical protein